MSLLVRFKKPGGLEKLVALLEGSDAKVRENILRQIRSEDPDFTQKVEDQLFFWPDLFSLDEMVLTDIVTAVQPKTMGLAMMLLEDNEKKMLARLMGPQLANKAKEEAEQAGEPNKSLIGVARKKVIETARELEANGKIKLVKVVGASATIMPGSGADEGDQPPMPESVKLSGADEEREYKILKDKWDKVLGFK